MYSIAATRQSVRHATGDADDCVIEAERVRDHRDIRRAVSDRPTRQTI
jgi:hypothetical protein